MRPLYSRLEKTIDRKFYRDKYEYRLTMQRAAGLFASIIELEPLLDQVLETIAKAANIERGGIVLKNEKSDKFEVMVARGYEQPYTLKAFESDNPLIRFMETELQAIQKNDVQEMGHFRDNRNYILKLMDNLGMVLMVPIIYEGRLTGILGLGEKKSGAWYSSEDIDMLQTLMMQTSVSIANAGRVEELKKMVELETSYRELQQIDRLKDNLLHMVSHDLRTPMTGILGYAALIHDGVDTMDRDEIREYLDIILKEGERLTRLINDLLDLQRFEAGRIKLDSMELDLVSLVSESVDVFRGTADQRGLELKTDFRCPEVTIEGDRDRLQQVVANLLSNAVKFTPEGGKITVSVDKTRVDGGLELARVEVADTGNGIPRELQPKLFDKFQQGHKEKRSEEEGSGLGLALVREIIHYHHGEVGVESEPGEGSVFFFSLNTIARGDEAEAQI